jgi:hypothetical protein
MALKKKATKKLKKAKALTHTKPLSLNFKRDAVWSRGCLA